MKDRGQVTFEAYNDAAGMGAKWASQSAEERRRWRAAELAAMARALPLGEAENDATQNRLDE